MKHHLLPYSTFAFWEDIVTSTKEKEKKKKKKSCVLVVPGDFHQVSDFHCHLHKTFIYSLSKVTQPEEYIKETFK